MIYFLDEKYALFKDKLGEVKWSELDILGPLQKVNSRFRQKGSYSEVISTISEFLSTEKFKTLILKSNLFCNSGFINTLSDTLNKESKVISDLEFTVNSQNLKDGQYSFIDLSENECCQVDFAIADGITCISSRTKLDIVKLKRILAKKFASTQVDTLYQSVTSYNNLVEANQYLTDYVGEEYDGYTLSDIALGEHFDDTYFSDLFEGISAVLLDFIVEHNQCKKSILLLTPFAAFQPVKEKLNSKASVIAMSIIDLINQTPSDKKYNINERYEVRAYPSNKTSNNCISSWMFSETNKLSFEFHSTLANSIEINLNDLKEELSSSSFSLQGKEVVKYFFQIERDACFNLHLKIETLDNKEFYYLINN